MYPDGIRHIRADKRVNEWKTPGKKTIVRCAVNQRQVVIALTGGELVYFEMDPVSILSSPGCLVRSLSLTQFHLLFANIQKSLLLSVKVIFLLTVNVHDNLPLCLSPQSGQLNEYTERKEMSADVVCMSLANVPPGEQRSRFLAVGLVDNTVRIISLDPSVRLSPYSVQPVRSVCLSV